MKLRKMWLNINGVNRMFMCNPEKDTLADVLRRMGLTGTKVGCDAGVCGSCSVLLERQTRPLLPQKDPHSSRNTARC